MKVTRWNRGYSIRLSEHEMDILRLCMTFGEECARAHFDSGLRRAFSRRTGGGDFLRVDADNRTDEYKETDQ